MTHLSFDGLRINDGADGLFPEGQSANRSYEATVEEDVTSLKFWGWVGIADAEVGLFGYQIDDNAPIYDAPIYDAAWTYTTEQGVLDAATPTGTVPSIYWYYVDGEHAGYATHASGDAVNIKLAESSPDRGELLNLPAGEYKLVLFADSGYTMVEELYITIK